MSVLVTVEKACVAERRSVTARYLLYIMVGANIVSRWQTSAKVVVLDAGELVVCIRHLDLGHQPSGGRPYYLHSPLNEVDVPTIHQQKQQASATKNSCACTL